MQVSVAPSSGLERKMTVQVPADRIDQEVEKRLKSMSGRVKVDGFRPGKVPMKVVKQRYGEGVFHEVASEVMQSSFYEAVTQEKLRPAGAPTIEAKTLTPGADLEYDATFEVYPEFEPASVDGVAINKTVAEVADTDVDKMIETLRSQRKVWEVVERASKDGDRIVIDFDGSVEGEAIEGGKAEEMPVELGQGRLIKSLEEQLVGLSAGDDKSLDVEFPEDYHADILAGKAAKFEVKVHKVEESVLPEVNDELAKQFGVEEGGVEALRTEIRNNMDRELRQAIQKDTKTQVMDALLQLNEVDVPQAMIQDEIKALKEQMMQSVGQQAQGADLPDNLFEEEARRRVKLGLVIGEIVRREDMKPEEGRVSRALEDLSANYDDPQQVIDYYRSNQQAMLNVESLVLEDQLVDWVLDKAKIEEVSKDFDSVMNPQTQAGE
jgi:trigger factor